MHLLKESTKRERIKSQKLKLEKKLAEERESKPCNLDSSLTNSTYNQHALINTQNHRVSGLILLQSKNQKPKGGRRPKSGPWDTILLRSPHYQPSKGSSIRPTKTRMVKEEGCYSSNQAAVWCWSLKCRIEIN